MSILTKDIKCGELNADVRVRKSKREILCMDISIPTKRKVHIGVNVHGKLGTTIIILFGGTQETHHDIPMEHFNIRTSFDITATNETDLYEACYAIHDMFEFIKASNDAEARETILERTVEELCRFALALNK